MSAESIGKTAFLGVAWPREAKPTPPGAAGGTVDQNWAKLGQNLAEGGPAGLYAELKSERQNGNSGYLCLVGSGRALTRQRDSGWRFLMRCC